MTEEGFRRVGTYASVDGHEYLILGGGTNWSLFTHDPDAESRGFPGSRDLDGRPYWKRPVSDFDHLDEVFDLSYRGRYRGLDVIVEPRRGGNVMIYTSDESVGRKLGLEYTHTFLSWQAIIPTDDPELEMWEEREPSLAPWWPLHSTPGTGPTPNVPPLGTE